MRTITDSFTVGRAIHRARDELPLSLSLSLTPSLALSLTHSLSSLRLSRQWPIRSICSLNKHCLIVSPLAQRNAMQRNTTQRNTTQHNANAPHRAGNDLDLMNFAYSPRTRILRPYREGQNFTLNNALNHPHRLVNTIKPAAPPHYVHDPNQKGVCDVHHTYTCTV